MTAESKWKVERINVCMHVTAIKTIRHILFVAEGNQVTLYNLNSKTIEKSEVVFSSSAVHGIRTDDNSKVLFFGSKSLKIYSFNFASSICLTSLSDEITFLDWIFDVQWINTVEKTYNKIAVITAHNVVTVVSTDNKKQLETVQCTENCILYAANVISTVEDAIVIAVGTVFRQILLWSPNSVSEINNSKAPLHCLEGHKGVIFSVCYNKYHKLLSSTSDDRSIRLWKVSSSSSDDSSLEFWEKLNIFPSHVLYAHESRVWSSAILENCILSVGEDSCICFWNMDGELLKKKKSHKGGSIWCLETSYLPGSCSETDNFNNCVAITGGSDGGVYFWEIQNILSSDLVSQVSLHVRSPSEKDFPRAVSIICFDDSTNLMTTTDKGWLSFYYSDQRTWKDIYYNSSFMSYCVSSVSNKSDCIALGNLSGDLVLLNSEDLSEERNFKKFKIHSGKIFSLHWVDKYGEYLLSCGAAGQMILWKVEYQNNTFNVSKHIKYYLPKCKPHWWSTCGLYIDTSNCLMVGDRGGNINFYSPDSKIDSIWEPNMIQKYIHGENGVTDIQEAKSLIYSAGRDGRVLVHCIKDRSLHLLHAIKISHELEWIGKMLFYGSDLLLLGFHTKYFIVWSTSLESTVMTVECGGGHRSWDFNISERGFATFTAVKKKDIIFASEDLYFTLNKSILKAGISGKEFCQICYLFTSKSSSSESMAIFAAGGEDNALQIIGFIDGKSKSSQMVTLNSLSGHLSSIRSLAKCSMMEENAFLLVSVGGRAQMMLWKLKNNTNTECEQLASHILSTAQRCNRKPLRETQDVQVDPQTRLMDVSVSASNPNHCSGENFIVALACSDSFFRVYNFNATENLLSLYYNIQLGEQCNLKLSCIQNSEEFNKDILFVIATTSGHLNVVSHENLKSSSKIEKVNNEVNISHKPHFQIHLHQSGINAVDIKHISDKIWLICTGGDDNALSTVIVKLDSSNENCDIIAKACVCSAHSSQITGVKLIGQNAIVSSSIDQRINLWKWNFSSNILTVTMLTSKISVIPDIANLECWNNRNNTWTALICGEGVESLAIENIA